MDLCISPISIVEEMAKEIRDKSDVVCNFYQSAEDVPNPRELSSEKKCSEIRPDRRGLAMRVCAVCTHVCV